MNHGPGRPYYHGCTLFPAVMAIFLRILRASLTLDLRKCRSVMQSSSTIKSTASSILSASMRSPRNSARTQDGDTPSLRASSE